MRMNPRERDVLREALEELAAGRDDAFEDGMWLGFGDDWRGVLDHLCRRGYVRIGGADRSTPAITPRGAKLIEQLDETPAAKAG